jgi:DNA polymerase-3 subunit epsilon
MRPGVARVMDIGIIRVENGAVVERYETLVHPGMEVPAFISGFTGIRDSDLADAPAFDEIALEVERMLKDAVFVAHNATFDYGFMKAEFARIGMDWRAETLCTVQLSRALFPRERSHSLDAVIERHGIDISDRHRALPDAEAVLQFLQKAAAMTEPRVLARAVASVRRMPSVPAGYGDFVYVRDEDAS